MADLLIELGVEELPAASVMPMANHLAKTLHDELSKAGLAGGAAKVYATPRRIAALLPDVGAQQEDQQVERKGPAVKAAYKDGEPSKALAGFLKGANATVDQLSTIETPKGDWLVLKINQPGRALAEIVSDAMAAALKTMPMPRRMRWSDLPYEFLRPVSWLCAVHGSDTVPLEFLGLTAGNVSYGHRFHAPNAITITNPADYQAALNKAFVVADFSVRRQQISEQVSTAAKQAGAQPVVDEALLDEVTALVEWPVAISGKFDPSYLDIPKEALIQTMEENQRYFALLDNSGNLLPSFITIANIESTHPQSIIGGNERVIHPRFADTLFFWEQDKSKKLHEHLPELDNVLFQEKLGSVGDKIRRIKTLGAWLAPRMGADAASCETAADLCKCDLTTEIVKELAKMQGIAGRYYAARDGHSSDIADAMEQHYFPKQAGSALPGNSVARVISVSDKIDTLVGIYGQGLKPTGAKDPFGLRRAALGVVRVLIEQEQDIDLKELVSEAISAYGSVLPGDANGSEMVDYILERLRGYAVDQGYTVDVVDAVLARGVTAPLDVVQRLQAIKPFRETPAAVSLSAASKRISNILKKASITTTQPINEALLQEPAEKALYENLQKVAPIIKEQFEARDYSKAMTTTAGLRDHVDTFFDDVMVMSEDEALKDNRLALLHQLNELCSYTADLSRLQAIES
ncbi:MAG: glycine--tRNA ligase subunit beta [Granulosicoccaceae bacterium]